MAEMKKLMLQKRIADVESRIANVTAQKRELEENAKNAKTEVQQSIGCQLERLRQREVQLMRQVDALIGHQGSLLQLQLAKLYQELGSLRAAQTFGHQTEIPSAAKQESSPSVSVRQLQYSAPTEGELCSAIQSFGRFEAALGPSKASVLLLPDEEAYEDSDHQLMHKTLQDKMQWTFPKPPPKPDDWVQSMKIEDFEMSDSESIELLCPSDIQDKTFWLLNNKNSSKSCFCKDNHMMEIENLSNLSCSTATWCSKGECKELLPIPDVASTCLNNNNKCTSYTECSCPDSNNCLLSHLREQTQRLWLEEPQKKQDCINNTLKEALRVDRSLWLNKASRRSDKADWLLRGTEKTEDVGQSESCLKLKKQLKELYLDNSDSWLANKRVKSNDTWIGKFDCM